MRRLGGVIGSCLVVFGVTACIKWPWMREDPAAHSAANWYVDAGSEGGSAPASGVVAPTSPASPGTDRGGAN